MNREEKAQIIEELVDRINNHSYFYITDASGLTVAEMNEFRKMCYSRGLEYKVFKNSLIKKALAKVDNDFQAFEDGGVLKGFSGILFSREVANLPAKVIKEYRKKRKKDKPLLKGAYVDNDLFVGNDKLDALSSLKSKEELIGEVIALLQSPAKNVIASLQSGEHKLAGIVKTLQDKKE